MERRDFLQMAALGTTQTAYPLPGSKPMTPALPGQIRFGISTYCYWHFRPPKTPVEEVIEKAARLGVSAVEVLHRQLDSEEPAYLQRIKRSAFLNGIDLAVLSIHQDFVDPDPAERKKNVDHTLRCIEIAARMGIPCIRLNSGRWNTIASFEDLMKARGEEPIPKGYREEDGFNWCIEAIRQCLPKAEENGVVLALENHWGLTRNPAGLLRIVDAIKSPWLGILMDAGNFMEDPYDKLEQIVSRTVSVHIKTYFGGGEWYSLNLNYKRIAAILKRAGYKGYVILEYEGKEDPNTAVPKSLTILRQSFGV